MSAAEAVLVELRAQNQQLLGINNELAAGQEELSKELKAVDFLRLVAMLKAGAYGWLCQSGFPGSRRFGSWRIPCLGITCSCISLMWPFKVLSTVPRWSLRRTLPGTAVFPTVGYGIL
jgi:hypothetical protein